MANHFARTTLALICVAAILAGAADQTGAAQENSKIRLIITTGGHPFDRKNFFAMWDSFPNVSYRETSQTKTSEAFAANNLAGCDVVAMYDMMPTITKDEEAALQAFLERGGGLVVLHHTICSRQQSPAFERIIGGKFLSKPETRDGRVLPQSVPTAGVTFRVTVADPKHPITRGVSDFEILDEPYSSMIVDPKDRVLLTTDEPKSTKQIAWTRREGKGRVAFIQLGHDNKAYANPNYRKLVEQALEWAAPRTVEGKKQK